MATYYLYRAYISYRLIIMIFHYILPKSVHHVQINAGCIEHLIPQVTDHYK